MRAKAQITLAFALAVAALSSAGAAAQQANPAHTHLGHVSEAFRGTPEGQGLLPTAVAEAKVVAQHATLATGDVSNLDAMKRHATHVLHALEPAEGATGPGLGYGLKKAATAAATHIELAAKAEGASQNVTTHANHIATSLRNTVQRADRIAELAQQIQAATAASDAAALVAELNTVAGQLIAGADANGDGRIGWQEGEGGLQHAEQHVALLKQGEGL